MIQGVHLWTLASDDLEPSLLELVALTFMHGQPDVNDAIARRIPDGAEPVSSFAFHLNASGAWTSNVNICRYRRVMANIGGLPAAMARSAALSRREAIPIQPRVHTEMPRSASPA